MDLIVFAVLLTVGYTVGRVRERRHLAELDVREQAVAQIVTVDLEDLPAGAVPGAVFVAGNVVVAQDYAKAFFAWVKSLFGGELRSYQTLLDRARREAVVQAKERAAELGATHLIGLRLETSAISNRKPIYVELFAYGTAVTVR